MRKTSGRVKAACKKLLQEDDIEEIIETHETPDYVQIHGKIGGDYVTFRVYDDGHIYEK